MARQPTSKLQSSVTGVRGKRGKIQIDFYYQGIRCRETLTLEYNTKNIKYAAQLRAAILFEISQGNFNYVKYFPNSTNANKFKLVTDITVLDMLIVQLANYQKREKNGNMSISSLSSYEKIITGHLMPTFGKYKLKEFKPTYIKDWLYSLNCSAKTIRNILIPLSKILKTAVNEHLIDVSPLDELHIDDIIKDVATSKKEVIDPFNNQEKEAVINQAVGQLRNLIQFGFWSGLRTGELIALQWTDIDFTNKIIHVQRNIVCGKLKEPKTKSGLRKILLLPKAEEALRNQYNITGQINQFIFLNPDTMERWQDNQAIRWRWRKLFDNISVRYRYPYQMRHTYASTLLTNGENIAWIATQLGHVNTEMVIKNYGKFIPDNNYIGGYNLKGKY